MGDLPREKKSEQYLEICIVILCVIVFMVIFAFIENVSFRDIIQKIINSFYSPNLNLMFVNEIGDINVNIAVLYLIVFASIIIKLRRRIKSKGEYFGRNGSYQASFLVSVIIIILLASIQTFNYIRYFHTQHQAIKNKTVEEKKVMIFGDLYEFSEFCKKLLPGRHSGRLITDMDLNNTTGAHDHIVLTYNLFPITIQYNPRQRRLFLKYVVGPSEPEPTNVLVVYQKKNPKKSVPKNFSIIGYFDESSLLAIRNE